MSGSEDYSEDDYSDEEFEAATPTPKPSEGTPSAQRPDSRPRVSSPLKPSTPSERRDPAGSGQGVAGGDSKTGHVSVAAETSAGGSAPPQTAASASQGVSASSDGAKSGAAVGAAAGGSGGGDGAEKSSTDGYSDSDGFEEATPTPKPAGAAAAGFPGKAAGPASPVAGGDAAPGSPAGRPTSRRQAAPAGRGDAAALRPTTAAQPARAGRGDAKAPTSEIASSTRAAGELHLSQTGGDASAAAAAPTTPSVAKPVVVVGDAGGGAAETSGGAGGNSGDGDGDGGKGDDDDDDDDDYADSDEFEPPTPAKGAKRGGSSSTPKGDKGGDGKSPPSRGSAKAAGRPPSLPSKASKSKGTKPPSTPKRNGSDRRRATPKAASKTSKLSASVTAPPADSQVGRLGPADEGPAKTSLSRTASNESGLHAMSHKDLMASSLRESAQQGDVRGLRLMRDRGADLTTIDRTGSNLAHYAAMSNSSEALDFVLAEGVNPSLANKKGQRPLDMAQRKKAKNTVQTLHRVVESANTDLREAAHRGDVAGCEAAIKRGADVNSTDEMGDTALHKLAQGNSPTAVPCAEYLFGQGSNPNLRNHNILTAEELARRAGHEILAKRLHSRGSLTAGPEFLNEKQRPVTPTSRPGSSSGSHGRRGRGGSASGSSSSRARSKSPRRSGATTARESGAPTGASTSTPRTARRSGASKRGDAGFAPKSAASASQPPYAAGGSQPLPAPKQPRAPPSTSTRRPKSGGPRGRPTTREGVRAAAIAAGAHQEAPETARARLESLKANPRPWREPPAGHSPVKTKPPKKFLSHEEFVEAELKKRGRQPGVPRWPRSPERDDDSPGASRKSGSRGKSKGHASPSSKTNGKVKSERRGARKSRVSKADANDATDGDTAGGGKSDAAGEAPTTRRAKRRSDARGRSRTRRRAVASTAGGDGDGGGDETENSSAVKPASQPGQGLPAPDGRPVTRAAPRSGRKPRRSNAST